MPFVTKEHRLNPDLTIPGDLCYIYYKSLVDAWKKEPRWTTAHNLYKQMKSVDFSKPYSYDALCAMDLAWEVFFIKFVMPYEDQKEKDNGTI